jgi:hypothetical protein
MNIFLYSPHLADFFNKRAKCSKRRLEQKNKKIDKNNT